MSRGLHSRCRRGARSTGSLGQGTGRVSVKARLLHGASLAPWRAAVLAAALASAAAHADPLAEPPPAWAGRVAVIAPQQLGELDPAGAERIRETRARLAELLREPGADAAELAAAYGRLGALYEAHHLSQAAKLAFGNARALAPEDFAWAYYLANLALGFGEAEAALEYLAAAAALQPDYPTLALRRGEALLGLNRLAEARAAYQEAAQDPALRAAALYGLAQIDTLERDWAAAVERLETVLELQPDADAAHYPLGQALVRLGRRDEARAHLAARGLVAPSYPDALVEDLRSLQRGARFHFEAAMGAVNRADHAAAAEAFAAGLAEAPDNARARTSYARTLWIAGRKDQALTELERAAADGPEETLPRFLLAVAADAQGDGAAAEAGYRAVLRLDPDHQGALSFLGGLQLRAGEPAAAAETLGAAIAAGTNLLPIYLQYWGALRASGAAESDLLAKLRTFDQRFPEPPLFRYLQAKLLATAQDAALRDPAAALEIARALYESQPIPPHAELLALVLAVNGQAEEAAQVLAELAGMARQAGAEQPAAEIEAMAARYRAGELPDPLWPPDDPLFHAPPADPDGPMRNYPAPHPY